jgi:hypothetical protein
LFGVVVDDHGDHNIPPEVQLAAECPLTSLYTRIVGYPPAAAPARATRRV